MDEKVLQDIFYNRNYDLSSFSDRLNSLLNQNIQIIGLSNIIDIELIQEMKKIISANTDTFIYFGKTLKDIKCAIVDDDLREHEILVYCKGPKKLSIVNTNLPPSDLQSQEYTSLKQITIAFKEYIDKLAPYFFELERIDTLCKVMEPTNPSFRENYRRILLDDRTWLHVEVTPTGLPRNIHLIGQSELWHHKLRECIMAWDYDKDITENITSLLANVITKEIPEFVPDILDILEDRLERNKILECNICLCFELPNEQGIPQPLCQNPNCEVGFHRNCLVQWLVASAGGRPPPFGVATGTCPNCLQPISCNIRDI